MIGTQLSSNDHRPHLANHRSAFFRSFSLKGNHLRSCQRKHHRPKIQLRSAPKLNAVLRQVATDFKAGGTADTLCQTAQEALSSCGFSPVDYVAIADAVTLKAMQTYDPDRPAQVLAAATLGRARLIDNIAVD